jgi:hypothetical protein
LSDSAAQDRFNLLQIVGLVYQTVVSYSWANLTLHPFW